MPEDDNAKKHALATLSIHQLNLAKARLLAQMSEYQNNLDAEQATLDRLMAESETSESEQYLMLAKKACRLGIHAWACDIEDSEREVESYSAEINSRLARTSNEEMQSFTALNDTQKALFKGEGTTRVPKACHSLCLSTDAWQRNDPPWFLVQASLETCYGKVDSGHNEFCALSQIEHNSYIQMAYSGDDETEAWRLEWRITDSDGRYAHYYATELNDVSRNAKTVSNLESVKHAFLDFFEDRGLPPTLEWHELDI